MILLLIVMISFLGGMVFFIGKIMKIALNIEDKCPTVTPGQYQEPEQRKGENLKTLTT